MEQKDFGIFSVRAFSASEAVPIEEAIVTIRGAEEGNGDIIFSLVTDEDGVTERIRLPAPSAKNSLTPNGSFNNSSFFDVEVSADGYYTKRYFNVPVFAGVEAVLPVNMIAVSAAEDGILFPRGNVNAIFEDTEEL